jgi:DNA-binding transcriptional regulator GbsR (MarR family)
MVCKSLVLSVSSMIASEFQRKTAMSETEVKQAVTLLDRAGQVWKCSFVHYMVPDTLIFFKWVKLN